MTQSICAIWGTPAEKYESAGDYEHFDSPRSGGQYKISRTVLNVSSFQTLGEDAKARLTTWVVNQHRDGIQIPLINSNVLEAAIAAKPMKMSEKIDRFFRYLVNIKADLTTLIYSYEMGRSTYLNGIESWLEIKNDFEMHSFMSMLKDQQYFNKLGQLSFGGITKLEEYMD
jgi:hypothetical protein